MRDQDEARARASLFEKVKRQTEMRAQRELSQMAKKHLADLRMHILQISVPRR